MSQPETLAVLSELTFHTFPVGIHTPAPNQPHLSCLVQQLEIHFSFSLYPLFRKIHTYLKGCPETSLLTFRKLLTLETAGEELTT